MFRKVPFNASLGLELKKELGKHFHVLENWVKNVLLRYPREVFALMIVATLVSIGLAFTIMRPEREEFKQNYKSQVVDSVSNLGNVLQAGIALNQVLEIQGQINAILKKDSLSRSDTLILKKAFDQLEHIHSQVQTKK